MKAGSENRKKTMMAAGLGTVALLCAAYAYNSVFGGPPNPAAIAPPAVTQAVATTGNAVSTPTSSTSNNRSVSIGPSNGPGAIPGVAAQKLTATSASLDPTLDQAAMLRTESLEYSGSGRNIFSATYTPPASLAVIPKQTISPRPGPVGPVAPVYTGPPPPPPINLKFFGTATRSNGQRQAWFLQGDDVYIASAGDIVARKYKIGTIGANSVQVTDLQNNNTQSLPYQGQ